MSERPKRNTAWHKYRREVVRGPADKYAQGRAEWMVESAQVSKYLAPKIKYQDKLAGKVEQGVSVLSVGAGAGHEMDEMDQLLPGSKVMGLDPNECFTPTLAKRVKELAHDEKYLSEHIRAENLEGIEDESLDGETLFFVLHHIDPSKYESVMAELSRVLKPDGHIFVAEDLVDSPEEEAVVKGVDKRMNYELTDNDPHNYKSKAEWEEFFAEYGFKVVDYKEVKSKKVRHGFFVLQKK